MNKIKVRRKEVNMKSKILFLVVVIIFFVTGCSYNKDGIVIYTSMEEERN